MRALVTGGAGFIGSHVVDALVERGDEVTVIDNLSTGRAENVNADAQLVELDIREALDDVFDDARPEACYHLAAQADVRVSVERPDYDAEVNVLGTVRVVEAARLHRTDIVFSSTGGAIYGECERPATEVDRREPLAPYGVSKLAGEEYLAMCNRLYGTRYTSLRYANVYGPRQNPHGEAGVVAIFLGRLADDQTPAIYGDGRQTRDYVYVADVVDATLRALRNGGVLNVGTGRETSVLELFEICRRVAGATLEARPAPARLGELQRSVLDATRAQRELGWRARHDLEVGVEATWRSIAASGAPA